MHVVLRAAVAGESLTLRGSASLVPAGAKASAAAAASRPPNTMRQARPPDGISILEARPPKKQV